MRYNEPMIGRLAQWKERLPYKQEVGGSIPPPPTNSEVIVL